MDNTRDKLTRYLEDQIREHSMHVRMLLDLLPAVRNLPEDERLLKKVLGSTSLRRKPKDA